MGEGLSASEARKLKAQRRREKVLKGGRDRLAFITGQASTPPPSEKEITSTVVEPKQSTSSSLEQISATADNVGSVAASTQKSVTSKIDAPLTKKSKPLTSSQPTKAVEGIDKNTALLRTFLLILLTFVYYVYMNRGMPFFQSTVAQSATAWFISFEVSIHQHKVQSP